MSENVCMPKSYFLFIILILVVLTYFHGVRMKKVIPTTNKVIIYKEKKSKEFVPQKGESKISNESPFEEKVKSLRKRDIDSLENNLKAPERRLPRHNYPDRSLRQIINIPTRGYPDDYHNVGMLVRKNDEKTLKLFGRQKYPGSNQWEYYVLGNDPNGFTSKFPLQTQGNKELFNNETIGLPWLDQSKGKFEIKLFDYDAPRYNPYDF